MHSLVKRRQIKERLLLLEDRFDPFQFAHQSGKSVDEAERLILEKASKHLEKPKSFIC